MDPQAFQLAYFEDVQWPLDLYTELNVLDETANTAEAESLAAGLNANQQPPTVRNDLAMLMALNEMSVPLMWSATSPQSGSVNEQAIQNYGQDLNVLEGDVINQMQINQQYDQMGLIALVGWLGTESISVLG